MHLALETRELLTAQGIHARVVNLASWEIFEAQSNEYRESVLPREIRARVTVEEAATIGWHRYAGDAGEVLGIDTFGLSAPAPVLQKRFGFTPEDVAAAVQRSITNAR